MDLPMAEVYQSPESGRFTSLYTYALLPTESLPWRPVRSPTSHLKELASVRSLPT